MAYEMGHPILGDPIYGKGTLKRLDSGRLLLHAWRLAFEHPVSGKPMAFEAPLPGAFGVFLERGSGAPGK
jgi:23S rRNA pseudouridine1911/1915/1917 synthase